MWAKALKELQSALKKNFPDFHVSIGKDKPRGTGDYPFIYILPTELSTTEEDLRLGVVLYVGVMVKDREEGEEDVYEGGTLEIVNTLGEIQLLILSLKPKDYEILPQSYSVKDFSKQPPYFEGEVHMILRVPYLTSPTPEDV